MKHFLLIILIGIVTLTGCKTDKKTDAAEKETPLVADSSRDQDSEPVIAPIMHATAVVQWGETTIYIDPTGGAVAFEGHPSPDLVLITDIHGDHFHPETLQELDLRNATLVAPEAVSDQLPDSLKEKTKTLNNGKTMKFKGLTIEAIPMYNLREEAREFHVKGRGNGYVLEKADTRIYFSGDTEDIPEMRALTDIDKAFVCMNLPYTMTVERAADAVLEFVPDEVYPYHFRGRPDVSDVDEFKRLVNEGNPDIKVVQLDWYPNEPY